MIYRNAWNVNRSLPGVKEPIMQIEINCSNFTLSPTGLLTVQDAVGTRIVCRSGVLWVTQEGDVKDAIVGPFEVLTIQKPGRTVITALESSTFALMELDGSVAGAMPTVRHAAHMPTESVACS
jgi:Protein of unknown function (DUF2917)